MLYDNLSLYFSSVCLSLSLSKSFLRSMCASVFSLLLHRTVYYLTTRECHVSLFDSRSFYASLPTLLQIDSVEKFFSSFFFFSSNFKFFFLLIKIVHLLESETMRFSSILSTRDNLSTKNGLMALLDRLFVERYDLVFSRSLFFPINKLPIYS